MNTWKEKYITGRPQEHDRADRLIVTSSVCSEVAEQTLHRALTLGRVDGPRGLVWEGSERRKNDRSYRTLFRIRCFAHSAGDVSK